MVIDLPIDVTAKRTRDQHIDDHKRLHRHIQQGVFSADYGTLQDAVNDAISKRRPLVIAPGTHTLTAPLVIAGGNALAVSAYGATLQAGADMAALVELRDCTRCTWRGGWLKVHEGRTVDNALYIYRHEGQCTRNAVYDLTIEGAYTTGVRIGRPGDCGQCDHMYITNVECIGRANAGQVGIYVGPGVFGNCLNHTFTNIMLSGHDTHAVIDATNTYWSGVFLDRASVDFKVNATMLSIRGVRSEEAGRFIVTGGPAAFGASLSFEDIQWHGQKMADDGEWIQCALSGSLLLRNVVVTNPAVNAVIKTGPGAALLLRIDGLTSKTAYTDALKVSAKTTVQTTHYVKLDAKGAVESITTAL